MGAPLTFTPLPQDDPLYVALAKVGELYTATNFMTWWDARAFVVSGDGVESWNPSNREQVSILATFVEENVLPNYVDRGSGRFAEQIAKVGPIGWAEVREGLLDALKHHPVAGGSRPGTASAQFSPHAFMLLDVLEDQIAHALELPSGRALAEAGSALACTRLRPRADSVFEGNLYQHLFLVWAPGSHRLLWFDLGGSQ